MVTSPWISRRLQSLDTLPTCTVAAPIIVRSLPTLPSTTFAPALFSIWQSLPILLTWMLAAPLTVRSLLMFSSSNSAFPLPRTSQSPATLLQRSTVTPSRAIRSPCALLMLAVSTSLKSRSPPTSFTSTFLIKEKRASPPIPPAFTVEALITSRSPPILLSATSPCTFFSEASPPTSRNSTWRTFSIAASAPIWLAVMITSKGTQSSSESLQPRISRASPSCCTVARSSSALIIMLSCSHPWTLSSPSIFDRSIRCTASAGILCCMMCSFLISYSTKTSSRSPFSRSCRSSRRPVAPRSIACNKPSSALLLNCGTSFAPRRRLILIRFTGITAIKWTRERPGFMLVARMRRVRSRTGSTTRGGSSSNASSSCSACSALTCPTSTRRRMRLRSSFDTGIALALHQAHGLLDADLLCRQLIENSSPVYASVALGRSTQRGNDFVETAARGVVGNVHLHRQLLDVAAILDQHLHKVQLLARQAPNPAEIETALNHDPARLTFQASNNQFVPAHRISCYQWMHMLMASFSLVIKFLGERWRTTSRRRQFIPWINTLQLC